MDSLKNTISVIIPVYNIREYLDDCVKSVIAQTYRDIEIILVDDGATDGSGDICDKYAAMDNRIIVIHKENGGLASAWGAGVEKSSGNYVCFVDGDDWIDADMIEVLASYLQPGGSDAEVVSCNFVIEKKNERKKVTQPTPPGTYEGDELCRIKEHLLGDENRPVILSRCMKLISKKLISDNIKYVNREIFMSEDVNIMLPVILDAKRVSITEGGHFYHYRTVEVSMAHIYKPGLLKDIRLNYDTFLSIMEDKGVANAREQMDREYIRLLFLVMKNELRSPGFEGISRLKDIFGKGEIADIVKKTTVEVSDKSNRLLYAGMRKPGTFTLLCLKFIITVFDKVTN